MTMTYETARGNMVRQNVALTARHAMKQLTPGDRYQIARENLNALGYDPDVFDAARAEAAEQFPHASRRQLREIAEQAARAVDQYTDYRQERADLAAEQMADAVADAGEDWLALNDPEVVAA
jgi:hypothetical protein